MEFFHARILEWKKKKKKEYWNGLPFPPPVDLPDPGIKPVSPLSPALAGEFFTSELPSNVLKSLLLLAEYKERAGGG